MVDDITATGRHEAALMKRVEDAADTLTRAEGEVRRAREVRDQAVRAAVRAGIQSRQIARLAGVSEGLVSRIVTAPRG